MSIADDVRALRFYAVSALTPPQQAALARVLAELERQRGISEGLRSAGHMALHALEQLHGLDTETECVTIEVSAELAAMRSAINAADAAMGAQAGAATPTCTFPACEVPPGVCGGGCMPAGAATCRCTFAQRMQGDGCDVCNPAGAAQGEQG